ncbi:hypothetical protein ACSBR1_030173 [Camellia fascicularis]
MLGLSLPSRGARRRRRRRLRRLLRQRQISTLWATTYQPERYEKCLCFRASTRKRNTKWFVVNISNRDDDNDNDNDNGWTKKLRLSPISRKKCDSDSSLVCVDSTIYRLGGFYRAPKCYNNRPTKDVLCLDASSPSPRWKSIVSMNVGRTCPTTVVVNGKLYVMGGNFIRNPAKDTETDRWAEVFDPHTKKWSFLPKPPDDLLPLGDNLVMCLGLEDLHKIMVTPYNSSRQAYLYDISQNIWTSKHHVNLWDHRFVSRVDNKDTAVFGNTLYWYDKNYRSVNAYEWETGNLLSGKLKGLGTAGWKMEDIRVQKDIYLFHLSGKLFCLVWNEELSSTVHCSKFVVDKSCYSHDNCNGSLCAWVLSSQDYYLGHNTTLYDAALMNKKSLFDSAGKVQSHQENSSAMSVELPN